MGRKNIGNFSWAFQLLLWLGTPYHRFFYRRFSVKGKENIPQKTPVIFVANHQNGLMDPLAIIFSARKEMVFLARADIFRKKSIARLLYFLKVLPVFRPRDGFRSVDKNQEVFQDAIQALRMGRPVGILPEGNHVGQKRLRPLRKGAARMALLAEGENDFHLGLTVVPVGLDYSDYFHAGSDLLVVFGKPVPVGPYQQTYAENPPAAINALKDELAEALRKVMIDIRPEAYYDTIFIASELACPAYLKKNMLKPTLYHSFLAKKRITEALDQLERADPETLEALKGWVEELKGMLNEQGLKAYHSNHGPGETFGFLGQSMALVILSPVFIYGLLLNIVPYYLSGLISKKPIDPHLQISVRFGAGFFLYGIWLSLLTLLTLCMPVTLLWKVITIISIPLAGLFSLYYSRMVTRMPEQWRWIRLRIKKREVLEKLNVLKEKIVNWVFESMNK